ncbi:hypothetical protein ACMFMF_004030 [Clarireedia jacksonii]
MRLRDSVHPKLPRWNGFLVKKQEYYSWGLLPGIVSLSKYLTHVVILAITDCANFAISARTDLVQPLLVLSLILQPDRANNHLSTYSSRDAHSNSPPTLTPAATATVILTLTLTLTLT